MLIRTAALEDEDSLRNVYRAAFAADQWEPIAALAVDLLRETTVPEVIKLIAEQDGRIIGHVAFSPVSLASTGNPLGYILAPLAVEPAAQRSGVGSKLVHEGLQQITDSAGGIVFVYGDPNYYGRFGFVPVSPEQHQPPFPLEFPDGWNAWDSQTGQPPTSDSGPIRCVGSLNKPELW